MRKCLRCNAEMVENLKIITDDAMRILVKERGLFKGSFVRVVAAVCSECGYLETYVNDAEKLKRD